MCVHKVRIRQCPEGAGGGGIKKADPSEVRFLKCGPWKAASPSASAAVVGGLRWR